MRILTINTDFWIINVFIVFLLCVFFAGVVISQILQIAFQKNLFDLPNERKIHRGVVPRLGGIAFKPVIFFSIFFLLGIDLMLGYSEVLLEIGKDAQSLFFGFCAVMILYLLGIVDDLVGVKYSAKFIIQALCGIMLIAGGVWIDNLNGILGIYNISIWVGYPLTILATIFIINAINLIDGIDGLAAGLCGISCLFYGFVFFEIDRYIYSMLSFATLGVLLPFFYYNVFGKEEQHKKIFMGDTGSLTVGMIICFLSIKLTQCVSIESFEKLNPMVLAFSPLITPVFDVVRVVLHRARFHKNIFSPDKNHIHHKFLALGFSHRAAMIMILLISAGFAAVNLLLLTHINVNVLLFLDIFIWTVMQLYLSEKIKERQLFGSKK